MGRKATTIILSPEDRSYLETQTRAKTIQAQTACKTKIFLFKADGLSIDAIANTSDDRLPDERHKTIIRDYECKRLEMLSLLAGIDLQTGEAIPLVRETRNSKDYIEFLKLLDNKYPKDDRIRMILDNLKVHTSEETRKYLATVPGRFEFVLMPKHESWLNLVESFFSKFTRQLLKGMKVETKEKLVERIYKYFDDVNADPVVYHWKYRLI